MRKEIGVALFDENRVLLKLGCLKYLLFGQSLALIEFKRILCVHGIFKRCRSSLKVKANIKKLQCHL
jgi:hypothetical protein